MDPTLPADVPLIPEQRREKILRQLHRDQVLSVHQLTEMLGVSHMTVRRDIAALEQDGKALGIAGGVRIPNQNADEFKACPRAGSKFLPVLQQQGGHLGPHRASAEHGDT